MLIYFVLKFASKSYIPLGTNSRNHLLLIPDGLPHKNTSLLCKHLTVLLKVEESSVLILLYVQQGCKSRHTVKMWTWCKSFAPLCPVAFSSEWGSVFQSHLLTFLSLQPRDMGEPRLRWEEKRGGLGELGKGQWPCIPQEVTVMPLALYFVVLSHVRGRCHVLRKDSWPVDFGAVNAGTLRTESHTAWSLRRLK